MCIRDRHKLYVRAKLKQAATNESFAKAFEQGFTDLFQRIDDGKVLRIYTAFLTRNGIDELQSGLQNSLLSLSKKDSLAMNEAIDLCKNYYMVMIYQNIEPIAKRLLKEDAARRYIIEDSVLIRIKEGATLSAVVVRKR